MKKFVKGLFVALAVAAFLVMPVFALGLSPQDEVTDPVQLYVIAVVSSAILYGVRFLAARFPKIVISREWLSVLIYVVAFGLSAYWGGLAFPAFASCSDPVTCVSSALGWVNTFLLALAAPVSYATLIYNLILKRVLDGFTAKYLPPTGALLASKRK